MDKILKLIVMVLFTFLLLAGIEDIIFAFKHGLYLKQVWVAVMIVCYIDLWITIAINRIRE